MKKKYMVLLIILLVVPLVSADFLGIGGAWNNVSSVVRNWKPGNPGVVAVIILVVIFTIMGFTGWGIAKYRESVGSRYSSGEGGLAESAWKHRGKAWWLAKKPFQGVYYGAAGGYWLGKQAYGGGRAGYEWWRVRKDREKEDRQLKFDEEIDKRLTDLKVAEETLNREEKALDNQLFKYAGYCERLDHWTKEIGPPLLNMSMAIEKLRLQLEKGKIPNQYLGWQNLNVLINQFNILRQRHSEINQRYEGLIRAEEYLIIEKQKREQMEAADYQEEIRDANGELINLENEAKEAYDEYVALKRANADKRDIALQKKKFKEKNLRKRDLKKDLKKAEEKGRKDRKGKVLERRVLRRLREQENLLIKIQYAEAVIANANSNSEAVKKQRKGIEDSLKSMKKNSRYIKDQMKKLAAIDRKSGRLEKIQEKLEDKRQKFMEKERRLQAKETQVEQGPRIIPFNRKPQTKAA